jgi:hypothetical protein
MTTVTLDRVLTSAERLPTDERQMLEEILRQRRIEAWRDETAAEARRATRAFRSGKLKAAPVEDVIARLRAGVDSTSG